MNRISQVLATLEHYKVVVRDTMEYTLPKENYDINAFNEKKRSIIVEVNEATPLKSIITSSGENGQKFEELVREFHETVYGDDSTILKLAGDGLRVDHAQHAAIFKYVIRIHENVEMMVQGILRDAKSQNMDVSRLEALDKAEERLYRSVAYLCLSNELIRLFGEYNNARREAKGQETATSKFIGNDISEMIGALSTVRNQGHVTDNAFKAVEDKIFFMIECMTGRRDLPEGKNFGDIIKDVQASTGPLVKEAEPAFAKLYVPVIQELVKQAAENGNRIGENGDGGPQGPQSLDGEPTEIDPKTGMAKA